MPARVQLSEIVDALDSVGDETHSYVDVRTGKVILVMDEELSAVEDDGDLASFPRWRQDAIAQARSIEADDGTRFIPLPDRFEINEWDMMRDFAESLADDGQSRALLNAISGRGAFRYFKDKIHEFGLTDAWYKFRDDQYRQIAREWCEEKGIEVVE